MATEYQLSYTASEIDEKLGTIGGLKSAAFTESTDYATAEQIDEIRTYEGDLISVNLFNKNDPDVVEGAYIDDKTGELVAYNYRNTTGYIPVKNGASYIFPVDLKLYGETLASNITTYNSEKEYIGYITGTITDGLITITINNGNIAYIRSTINYAYSANNYGYIWDNMMIVEGTEYPSEYIAFNEYVQTPVLKLDLREDYIRTLLNPLYRRTILWAGDSICAGKAFDDENDAWAGRIAEKNQMTYYNYGVSGSTITEKLAYYSDGTEKPSISSKVETMYADYPNADYIIFEGGTNDADLLGNHLNNNTIINLFNKDDTDVVKGAYITATTGTFVDSVYRNTTGYIPVENGKSYTFPVDLKCYGVNSAKNIAIYNSEKEYIGYVTGTITDGLITITINNENIAYIRSTINYALSANDYGYAWDNMMIVEGTEYPTDYVAYDRFGTFDIADFSGNYNQETFCGALESIFFRATSYWKGKKIGYIVAQKMGATNNGYTAETNNRRNYFETAMAICNKWGIPVLNLWDGCNLNPSLPHMYQWYADNEDGQKWEKNRDAGNYYADGQHLLSAGYDYTADIINNWLKTL